MNKSGKQLIFDAFEHKMLSRTPWIPYTGVQIGSLSGVTAADLLKSEDLLVENLLKAHELYGPDGMPVIFDLQIEAEILGCELMWAEKAPPSVKTHPLSARKDINLKLPTGDEGRLPLVLNTMRRLKKEVGTTTALYGLICGPLTLASHLRGMNLFMDMYEDEAFVQEIIDFSTEVFLRMTDFYLEAGMDIIAAVDPIVSQISPATFQQFLSKPYSVIFEYLRKKKVYSGFFVCGDATKNLEVMCHTRPDSISIDENIDIVKAKAITDRHNIVISGNIPLTTVMLLGTQQDNQQYSIDLIEKLGNKNFILAPGCDMPYEVPQENIIGIAQAVQDPEATRFFLKDYHKKKPDIEVTLPDYNRLDKVLVEVFTIDSATCAACGYMTNAAMQMNDIFGEEIEIIERKITLPENIARLEMIGLKNLPALLINGQLTFNSIIPSRKELIAAIKTHL